MVFKTMVEILTFPSLMLMVVLEVHFLMFAGAETFWMYAVSALRQVVLVGKEGLYILR